MNVSDREYFPKRRVIRLRPGTPTMVEAIARIIAELDAKQDEIEEAA